MSITISSPLPDCMERAWHLYIESFPPEERRPWQQIAKPADGTGPQMLMIADSAGKFAGFITTWHFPAFTYVEHFAIEPERRGTGIGGEAIAQLVSRENLPVVLEVERPDPQLPLTERRIRFYARHGFKILPYNYIQPPYSRELPEVPLMLMSTSSSLDPEEVSRTLHREVYGVGRF